MPRTPFLSAAYNFIMEQILARLLMSALKDNPQGRETLVRLLQFYRDNRELLMLVLNLQSAAPPAADVPPPESATAKAQQESRPQETVGSVSVLEEYLKKAV